MSESRYSKPDLETLRRAIEQLGFTPVEETWLDRVAFQLGGFLDSLRPLDDLDLSKEEPATVFKSE